MTLKWKEISHIDCFVNRKCCREINAFGEAVNTRCYIKNTSFYIRFAHINEMHPNAAYG